MLEAVEASFDAMAFFVEFTVVAALLLPMLARRDHGQRAETFDLRYNLGRVVALVSDDGFGAPALEHRMARAYSAA